MTEAQAADLLSVAYHESSHAWIAVVHGAERSAIRLFVYPVGERFHGKYRLGAPITDPIARVPVGLSGTVGQLVHWSPDVGADRLYGLLVTGRVPLTLSDARLASDYGPDDVAACMALVRRQWKRIEITAAMLVQHTIDRLAATA
jgi:hypothetical protein